MNIKIGRGGNQKPVIKDKSVPPYQGYFAKDEDGDIIFHLRSVKPIYFNGERASYEETLVPPGSKVTLGDNLSFVLEELLEPMDIEELKDWGNALRRFDSAVAAHVFWTVSLTVDDEDNYPLVEETSAGCCEAYYLIESGKFKVAQEMIYEVADVLFDNQDGSEKLRRAYTAVLGLAAYFYFKIGQKGLAKSTLEDFRSVISSGVKCSEEVMDVVSRITL